MSDTKHPEYHTAASSDEKDGELKRREVSRDSTTRSPASKRPCIPLNTLGDEIQGGSADFITSGDSDDKHAITKLISTSRPPAPVLIQNESMWRKFVYDRLDMQHSRVRDLWVSLRCNISYLVKEWMPERYLWEDLSEESQKEIGSWACNAKVHIEHDEKEHLNALFEGWIFHLLYENLFSRDCHDKWSSPDWTMFGQLQRIYSNHAENSDDADSPFNIRFHNWRRISSGMLFDMHKDAWHTEPGRLYNILAKHLEPLFLSESRVRAPDKTSHEYLEWMVYEAIKLDALMINSPISLTMKMRDPATGKVNGFPLAGRKPMLAPFADLTYSHVVDFIYEPWFTIHGYQGSRPTKRNWKDLAAYRSSATISQGVGAGYAKIHHEWKFLVATSQITGPAAGEDHDLPQPTENPEEA